MINWRETLESQFANSPTLVQLIDNMNAYIDPALVLDEFYDVIWNIDTAQGFGLDIWGDIVGVSRVVQIANVAVNGQFLGWKQALDVETFGYGIFYSPATALGPLLVNYDLTDEEYRALILAKAFSNISDGSIGSINAILMAIYGADGNVWVKDNQDMSLTYTFDFTPTPIQQAILFQSGALPSPAGVVVLVEWVV